MTVNRWANLAMVAVALAWSPAARADVNDRGLYVGLRLLPAVGGADERLTGGQGGGGTTTDTDPYQVLGINQKTTDAEVKKAYRKLIRENHPDTLIAKGMPQEFIDVANEKMAAINAAYDLVEKERGLK